MKSRTLQTLAVGAAVALLAGCAGAVAPLIAPTPGCLADGAVDRLMADYNARRPATDLPVELTMADAVCTRGKLQQRLRAAGAALIMLDDPQPPWLRWLNLDSSSKVRWPARARVWGRPQQ